MKLFLLGALAILALAHAGEVVEEEHEYIYFPDGEGVVHLIDLKQAPENLDRKAGVETITFNLFTKNNKKSGQVLTLDKKSTVTSSNWLSSRPTRFVTHGWHSSGTSDACTTIRDAYLKAGDYNVIVIDWNEIASSTYNTAAGQVKAVAAQVALFIKFMINNAALDVSTTYVIGHSLGGHIAGLSARGAGGKIAAVVGLDPAYPLFSSAGSGSAISKSDAKHVQVIHTSAEILGIKKAAGTSDFFPNGGKSQPGCGVDLAGSCSHGRAYYYYAESVSNPKGFPATAMRSADLPSLTERATIYMGGPTINTNAKGSYTLTTASKSPYALG